MSKSVSTKSVSTKSVSTKSVPTNKALWEKAKKEANIHYKKPSAYKSGFIVKYYKDHGGKFKGTFHKKTGLSRWFLEEWTNQKGEIGYKKTTDLYRPNKKITAKTPKTWKEISNASIKKAKRQKSVNGRVKKFT
jgi:hypothetical protein